MPGIRDGEAHSIARENAEVIDRKPVTSADVARAAGVSRTTVSLVLNGVETISLAESTKARVRRAAEELGYVPHSGAQALRSGYSGIVLMPSAATALGRIVAAWTTDLEDALNALGLTFVIYGSRGLGPVDAARAWSRLRPVAVLTLGSTPLTPEASEVMRTNGTRALLSTGEHPIEGTHVLVTGQADAGAVAVEHLLERGRRRIGIVTPRARGLEAMGRERFTRADRVARAQGASTLELPMSYNRESAIATADAALAAGLDGVYAYDDDFALLLLGAFARAGVGVPTDLAVVGTDDLVEGSLASPSLSTVRIAFPPAADVASIVAGIIQGNRENGGITFATPPALIARESS